jgi:hypothetical protein
MARFHESHPGLAHAELDFYGEREREMRGSDLL